VNCVRGGRRREWSFDFAVRVKEDIFRPVSSSGLDIRRAWRRMALLSVQPHTTGGIRVAAGEGHEQSCSIEEEYLVSRAGVSVSGASVTRQGTR
jgi:hypothetical protein